MSCKYATELWDSQSHVNILLKLLMNSTLDRSVRKSLPVELIGGFLRILWLLKLSLFGSSIWQKCIFIIIYFSILIYLPHLFSRIYLAAGISYAGYITITNFLFSSDLLDWKNRIFEWIVAFFSPTIRYMVKKLTIEIIKRYIHWAPCLSLAK